MAGDNNTLPYRTVTEETVQNPDNGNPDSKNAQECKKFSSIIKTLSDMMET